jgi:hypothetical protein
MATAIWEGGARPPAAVSVSPSSGAGPSQTFGFLYSDPNGATDLANVYLIFNSTNSYVSSCGVTLNNSRNVISLIQDSGAAWTPGMVLGQPGTLQNSQCAIDVGNSSTSRSGSDLTLNLAATFQPSFAGPKNIFMKAVDREGMYSSWENRGAWTPGVSVAPIAVSVTPSSGAGGTQTFSFTYSDANGYADLANVYLLFNTTNSYLGSCGVTFNNSRSKVSLIQDSGTAWLSPLSVGVPGALQNSQCSLDLGASSVTRAGNDLTLRLAITFKPAFAGTRSVFMKAVDGGGLASSWLKAGSWTVQ